MRARLRHLQHRLGHRGALLTLKGVIATLYGYGQLTIPAHPIPAFKLLLRIAPLHAWGVAWMAAGCLAFACAWLPPGRDWPGFAAVWLVSSAWAAGLGAAWWPLGVYPGGWLAAVLFASFGLVCLVAIGWEEPPPVRRLDGREERP